jgi:ribose 5-phosphate isomerase A
VVDRVGPPVPLEVLRFGLSATLRRLAELGEAVVREGVPVTADGNVIVDFLGKVDDPNELASVLAAVPGVVEHGLFPPNLVSEVLVGRADGSVERLLPG